MSLSNARKLHACFSRLTNAGYKRYVRCVEIGEGTHTVLLEKKRVQLFNAVQQFFWRSNRCRRITWIRSRSAEETRDQMPEHLRIPDAEADLESIRSAIPMFSRTA
jgi:hypothetical protein